MEVKLHGVSTQLGILLTVVMSMLWSGKYARVLILNWFPRIDTRFLEDMVVTADRIALVTSAFTTILAALANLIGRVLGLAHQLSSGQAIAGEILALCYVGALVCSIWYLPAAPHAQFKNETGIFSQRNIAWSIVIGVNVAQLVVIWFL